MVLVSCAFRGVLLWFLFVCEWLWMGLFGFDLWVIDLRWGFGLVVEWLLVVDCS